MLFADGGAPVAGTPAIGAPAAGAAAGAAAAGACAPSVACALARRGHSANRIAAMPVRMKIVHDLFKKL